MFNSVQFVRDICKERGIPVSQLEKSCGFSNGYLNAKKLTRLPYDRAQLIADYLRLDVTLILTGEKNNAPAPEGRSAVTDDDIKFALFGGDGEITDEMYEEVKRFAAFIKNSRRD
jgi:hypothetical protein